MKKYYDCCLCGGSREGFGNNPQPVVEEGRCCDECNRERVIPARIEEFRERLKQHHSSSE